MSRTMMAIAFFLMTNACFALRAQSSAKDCLPVLSKDYYSYAEQHSLLEDFIRSIDSESWAKHRESHDISASALTAYGFFSYDDDYKSFDEKRAKYLENLHYRRDQQQALAVLKITTAERAYPAYEACLRSIQAGPAVLVWASKETPQEIQLHVKWVGPVGGGKVDLAGSVTGGSVQGQEPDTLWSSGFVAQWWSHENRWLSGEEKVFSIKRDSGTSETSVKITPSDHNPPAITSFSRADALLGLTYVGTTDVVRQKGRVQTAHSPNNHENRGNCPNQVGRTSTGVCISRTSVTLATKAPRFLTNGRPTCSGAGCPYGNQGPVSVSPDGASIWTYFDNWGSDVDLALYADEYEHAGGKQCGSDVSVPVVRGQAVLFASATECGPIANLKWKSFPEQSEGAFRFGDAKSPTGNVIREGNTLVNGDTTLASYKWVQ